MLLNNKPYIYALSLFQFALIALEFSRKFPKKKTFRLPFERNFSNFHLTKKLNGVNDNLLLLGFFKFIKIATILLFYVAWTTTDDDGDAKNDVTQQTKRQLSIFYSLNACQFLKNPQFNPFSMQPASAQFYY